MAAILRLINKAIPQVELYPLVFPVMVACGVGVATMYIKMRGDTDVTVDRSHPMPFMTERSQKGPVLGKWVFHSETMGGIMSSLPEEYQEKWVKEHYPAYYNSENYPAHVVNKSS
mmetsp:Transcript_9223/g.15818  ORF Transcript_9223/g.15818 Transcript_9223/m.15818 type:complete len:115 (-) Transcript_9223:410-754(-)|eukprot:CAMPEP_0196652000 /NCGR_PEP_ID=MMETSP1086-20130531/1199_1 /TAXON_ID=77921 /ORGANISM="Cyanoptyche  gloeocystis , Strain SAG4.97" /LENGTH=114 /DNA_ID=CAMNT_0041982327 /DNA_START=138 /DNA_END=482 /DNA_ORIENTATION=-